MGGGDKSCVSGIKKQTMSTRHQLSVNASLVGAFLAGMTISLILGLPHSRTLVLLAILLAALATIYLGAALSAGRTPQVLMEGLAACGFIALAMLGVWRSPFFLVIGYLAHGLWDLAHHRGGLKSRIAVWWPPFCLVYDWVLAGAICLRWFTH